MHSYNKGKVYLENVLQKTLKFSIFQIHAQEFFTIKYSGIVEINYKNAISKCNM